MGIQVIAKAKNVSIIENALGHISNQCEVFPIEPGHFGLSIPTKVVDSIGESATQKILSRLEHFDLWAGSWKKQKPIWQLW